VGLTRWDLTAVLDPLALTDGQHDLDLLAERWLHGDRLGLLLGWRATSFGIAGGYHHQQRALLGLSARVPLSASHRLRAGCSIELATLLLSHGDGAPTEWIALDRRLIDHVGLGLFVRVEYALDW
jgi:hypothetical protein